MEISLTPQETEEVVHSLKKYFSEEFDQDLTELKAKMLLDYFAKELAPFAYNQGVKHAEEFFRGRLEDLTATCYEPAMTYWQKKKK